MFMKLPSFPRRGREREGRAGSGGERAKGMLSGGLGRGPGLLELGVVQGLS